MYNGHLKVSTVDFPNVSFTSQYPSSFLANKEIITLETSALETRYGEQFMSSTQNS